MGKKVKRKARSAHKEKRTCSNTPHSVSEHLNQTAEVGKERKSCNHVDKGIDLNKISSRIGFVSGTKCGDCGDGLVGDKWMGKGGGKQGMKKGIGSNVMSESKSIWFCLECGHFACGGAVGDSVPQKHAEQHSKQSRHPCAVQFKNPLISWCFHCKSTISVGKSEENGETDLLYKAQELIKKCSSKGVMDAESVWFGENDERGIKIENGDDSSSDATGYSIGGLVNLGNTCFFNSVLQNLLAMDLLRGHFLNLERSVGPLSMALKKLFNERSNLDVKSCINPKALFGCICAKAPQFRGYQQQDSHELLRCLLDGLHTEELSLKPKLSYGDEVQASSSSTSGATFVDTIFGGQLSSTVCCVECGHSSTVYEPFLDLSLPVPTKKPLSKKTSVTHPKKTKLPSKEGNKGRKFRERKNTNAASGPTKCAAESSLPSECGNTSSMAALDKPNTEQTNVLDDMNCAWMDYLGLQSPLDNVGSVSLSCDNSVIEDSQSMHNEDAIQSTCEHFSNVCSLNQEKYSNNDAPLCVKESEILLLTNKEDVSTVVEGVDLHRDPHDADTGKCEDASSRNVSATATPSSFELDENELSFDGLGDLFNEPETVVNEESNDFNIKAGEEIDSSLLANNSSESNQDEVDNTKFQVSIDSCLGYFTKPELLSGEHAWNCDNCLKILQDQMIEVGNGKSQTSYGPTAMKAKQSKLLKIGDSCAALDGGLESMENPTTIFECLNSHVERIDTTCTNDEKEMLIHAEESEELASVSGQPGNGEKLYIESGCSGLSQIPEVSQSGEDLGKLIHVHQGTSCESSFHGETDNKSSLNSSCSKNFNHNTKDKGLQSKAGCGKKKVQRSVGMNNSVDGESKDTAPMCAKVKRDATKRILINKAPSILAIHLKRFSQDTRGRLNKLNGHVNFLETLDLRPYMDPRGEEIEKCKYHLIGVVEHSGTMRGGHYVAYVKVARGGKTGGSSKWYYTSDLYVNEVTLPQALQSEAYILFYEKL